MFRLAPYDMGLMASTSAHRIAVIGGDGIGPEVITQALKVVRAAGVSLDTTDFDLGGARYLRDGEILSDAVLDQLRSFDAILLGAVGTPDVPPGVNLGTGSGVSVLQLVAAFEQATGVAIPCQIFPRRQGDVASCYAATDLAIEALSWRASLRIEAMCADAWRWELSIQNGVDRP